MQAIDGPTLLIILIAGFYLGLLGIFGFDFIDWSIGDHYKRWIFALCQPSGSSPVSAGSRS